MNINALITSIIGGTIVVIVNHYLTNRHKLLMKRELYREILYREKVRAYDEVYALATAFLQKVNGVSKSFSAAQTADAAAALWAVRNAIEKRSLFMPDKIFTSIRGFKDIADKFPITPSIAKARYKLSVEPPEKILHLLTGEEECVTIAEILKHDLGVETLTKDLGEFFRTAALQIEKKSVWKVIVEKIKKCDGNKTTNRKNCEIN